MRIRWSLMFLGASFIINTYGSIYLGNWSLNYQMGYWWNVINILTNVYFIAAVIIGTPALMWNMAKYQDYGLGYYRR